MRGVGLISKKNMNITLCITIVGYSPMLYGIKYHSIENEIKYGAGKGKDKHHFNQNGEFEFIYYNGSGYSA
jgi:hypothetical protein